MKKSALIHFFLASVSLAAIPPSAVRSDTSIASPVISKKICPGITLTEEIDSNPPEIIHVLTVDPSVPGVHLESIPGRDSITGPTGDIHQGREEVRSLSVRHAAAAAVNGDYFPMTGDPYGAAVWNGNLYSEPYPGRCVMGIGADGKTVEFNIIGFLGELQTQQNQLTSITGVDRMVSSTDTNDLVVFTPTFGPRSGIRPGCVEVVLRGVNLPLRTSKLEIGTVAQVSLNSQVGSAIPSDGVILAALPGGQAASFLTSNCKVGDHAEFVCAMAPAASLDAAVNIATLPRDSNDQPIQSPAVTDSEAYAWATMSEVIAGGPRLVVNGVAAVDGAQETFSDALVDARNPRTAVGVTSTGQILLVTVDGRQALSNGVSLQDLAGIMIRYGAHDAMNLDGGGSTTMVVNGLVVNSIASIKQERPVANSLCVFSAADTPPSSPSVLPPSEAVESGQAPATAQPEPSIIGVPATVTVGDTAQLELSVGSQIVPASSSSLLWGGSVGNGIAYVDQAGHLTALSAGQSMVEAVYDGHVVQAPIVINPSTNGSNDVLVSANLVVKALGRPDDETLIVGVFTQDGMPDPAIPVHVDVSGGSVGAADITTDIDGYAQTDIRWSGKGGIIQLTSPGLIGKIVPQQQP